MEKILIVEDDETVHNLINEILMKQNYIILNAYSGTEALLILEKENVDLILLDLMLPGLKGEDIIKKIHNIPTIVISAKTDKANKIKVLLDGANDYIVKPFDTEELIARIKVQLRMKKHQNNTKEIKYKNIKMLEDNHFIEVNNEKIYLTRTEYAILKQLILNENRVITKSNLLQQISLDTPDCDENSLKVHISNIRKKIKNITEEEYIESVWGIGFKMKE